MTTPAPAPSARQRFLNAYEARTTTALSVLALVFLLVFSAQAIWPDRNATWYVAATWFSASLWVIFIADLVFRLSLADSKKVFLRRNWLDVVTVVIPQLRPLRAVRAMTSGGVLSSKGKGVLSGGAIGSAVFATAIVVWVGALMVLNAERYAPGAEITSFGDACWWAIETITTVGYGDFVPVTPIGRALASLVMFAGISVVGVVSASLAATLVKQAAPVQEVAKATDLQQAMAQLSELKGMIASLQQEVSALRR